MLAPVAIGVALNRYFAAVCKIRVTGVAAGFGAGHHVDLRQHHRQQRGQVCSNPAAELILAVFLLHTGGFFLGYIASRLLRCDELTSRTISVEVGMQNSGLGAALAEKHFTSLPLAPLPCAISATFHSVIGSCLAGIWRLRPVRADGQHRPNGGQETARPTDNLA